MGEGETLAVTATDGPLRRGGEKEPGRDIGEAPRGEEEGEKKVESVRECGWMTVSGDEDADMRGV